MTAHAKELEARHLLQVYGQLDIDIDGASGVYLQAGDQRILDLYGGHAVACLGYGHPELLNVMHEQAQRLFFQSNAVALPVRAEAAGALAEFAATGLERVFFCNTGAEANENALRIACRLTGRKRVAAIEHGFHGRSAAAGAVTYGASERWYGFPRAPFEVDFIERNNPDAAEVIGHDTAAVIIELVQGVAGAVDLDTPFVKAVADACSRHGALLIVDEVQSGIGRCGEPFAADLYGIQPDLLTTAKSLAGGFPCGALLLTEAIASELSPGDLGTTFGGGPLACALVAAVLKIVRRDNLMANAKERFAQLAAALPLGPVTGIQGKGLLIGLRCEPPARDVQKALLAAGMLTGSSADPHVLRLLPPLVLEARHIDEFLEALNKVPV